MSTGPQGELIWPGIATFISGQFTLAHGVEPSVATILIAEQVDISQLQYVGSLVVAYGGDSREFPNCMLDAVDVVVDGEGRRMWRLTILDRRWVWKECGWIAMRANVRRGDSDVDVWPDSLAPPQEIASLYLEALGEVDFDVSQLPNDDLPEIDDDYEAPGPLLLEFVDKYGCRPVLTLDDTVRICRTGVGADIPKDHYVSGNTELNPPNYPSAIQAFAAKTKVQFDLTLFPVGLELNGDYLPIDELSYTPENGWDIRDFEKMLSVEEADARAAALKSVYRCYQAAVGFTLSGLDPDDPANEEIVDIEQILPLDNVQITKQDETGEEPSEPLPAWVFGIWCTQNDYFKNNTTEVIDIESPDQEQGYYPRGFSLDQKRGIVKFNEPVFMLSEDGQSALPADLRLRTSFPVINVEFLQYLRFSQTIETPNALLATPPKAIKCDDIGLQLIFKESGEGPTLDSTNVEEVQEVLAFELQNELARYQLDAPENYVLPGFVFMQPDGAITQITWTVDGEGKATTSINRNREDLAKAPSYEELKNLTIIKRLYQRQKSSPRAEAEDLRMKGAAGMGESF